VVINGVIWRTRSGSPWRDLPAEYGNWKTVYNRHRRWSADRSWARILDELRRDADGDQGPEWTVGVDGGVVRAHQHAAGARHAPPGDVAPEVLACTEVAPGGFIE
jgi:transposase